METPNWLDEIERFKNIAAEAIMCDDPIIYDYLVQINKHLDEIASKRSCTDDKMTLLKQQLENLQKYIQSQYESDDD